MKTCLALAISLTLLASQAQAGFVLSSPLHVQEQPRAPSYKEFLAANQPKPPEGEMNPDEAIARVDGDVSAPIAITPQPTSEPALEPALPAGMPELLPMPPVQEQAAAPVLTPVKTEISLSQTLQGWGRADGVTIVNEAGTDLSINSVPADGSFTEKVDALLSANPQIGTQMVFKFYQADPKAGTPPVLHVTKGG